MNKENRGGNATTGQPTGSTKKTGVVSVSHSSSTKARKAPAGENCVAYSFDDAMIDKLTEIPPRVDRNEWLATHSRRRFKRYFK